jgi:hypothetical protein
MFFAISLLFQPLPVYCINRAATKNRCAIELCFDDIGSFELGMSTEKQIKRHGHHCLIWKSRTTVTHGSRCPSEHGTKSDAFQSKRVNKLEYGRGRRDNWHTRRHKVATLDKNKIPFVGVCKQLFFRKKEQPMAEIRC